MIVLDENFPETQRRLLRSWRVQVRQVGLDLGRAGMKDDEIIPLLRSIPRPTFITLDRDFYSGDLCERRFGLVMLSVSDDVAASFSRRLLRHPSFNSTAKRLGTVLKITVSGIHCRRIGTPIETVIPWA